MTTQPSVAISLRTRPSQLNLIDRAAAASGKDRTAFMLEAACREAENILLDRRLFQLDEETWKRFTTALDTPPINNPALAGLLARKPRWES